MHSSPGSSTTPFIITKIKLLSEILFVNLGFTAHQHKIGYIAPTHFERIRREAHNKTLPRLNLIVNARLF